VERPELLHARTATIVIDTIAEATRYPKEILTLSSRFDEDLGIDSLKRAEIVTVLLDRFGAPVPVDLKALGPPPLTIGELTDFAVGYLGRSHHSMAVQNAARDGGSAAPSLAWPDKPDRSDLRALEPIEQVNANGRKAIEVGRLSREEVERLVIDTIAEVARYPQEILTADARFDEDLGIDPLKRTEIVAKLFERYGATAGDLGPAPLTIGELTSIAFAYVNNPRENRLPPSADRSNTAGFRPLGPSTNARTLRNESQGAAFAGFRAGAMAVAPRLFDGKLALVSGSGHGLGKVIAKQLAELGAHVIINSFHSRERGEQTTEEILTGDGKATHLWGSFANAEHINKIFHEIEQRFGQLDYYVHNASDGVIASLDKVTEAHWEKAFRSNIVGYHLSAMRAAKLMQRSGGGIIVALSCPGAQRYLEYFGCLGPVKAALESLTMYLAREFAPHGVRVNAVSAGPIYGERMSSYPDRDRLVPYWESLSANGRLGDPEEIADAVIFLLSPAARRVNGSTMLVDGAAAQKI
jgi:NAD(P)-dependent dehydrogenase (short-subunit alcohol dehydrogenase family)/acyl carrier protein